MRSNAPAEPNYDPSLSPLLPLHEYYGTPKEHSALERKTLLSQSQSLMQVRGRYDSALSSDVSCA